MAGLFQWGLPAAVEMQAEIQRVKGLYEAACAAAGDEEGDDPLFATPDEGFGMEADDEGKKVKIKKLHKRCLTRFSSSVRQRSSRGRWRSLLWTQRTTGRCPWRRGR